MDSITQLKDSVANAKKVLIGIGNGMDYDFTKDLAEWEREKKEQCPEWLKGYLHRELVMGEMSSVDNLIKAYEGLKKLTEGKDYYIISLCMDDVIYRVFDKEDKVVTPCGGFRHMQCSSHLFPVTEISNYPEWNLKEGIVPKDVSGPTCPICGEPLVFNNMLYAENYLEEGYLEKFADYKKWLQTTVNKELCILELGVGMRFPSVIRFAFDKLAYYNLKSKFYRVHPSLYQHTSENKERGIGIALEPAEFLRML